MQLITVNVLAHLDLQTHPPQIRSKKINKRIDVFKLFKLMNLLLIKTFFENFMPAFLKKQTWACPEIAVEIYAAWGAMKNTHQKF